MRPFSPIPWCFTQLWSDFFTIFKWLPAVRPFDLPPPELAKPFRFGLLVSETAGILPPNRILLIFGSFSWPIFFWQTISPCNKLPSHFFPGIFQKKPHNTMTLMYQVACVFFQWDTYTNNDQDTDSPSWHHSSRPPQRLWDESVDSENP